MLAIHTASAPYVGMANAQNIRAITTVALVFLYFVAKLLLLFFGEDD